jgi:ubiquinone/menaquinone biosynthesis C-methylase UbiE
LARDAKLGMTAARDMQALRTLLRCASGALAVEAARNLLPSAFQAVLEVSDGLPFGDGTFDLVFSSLVLSYMERVEDTLFEVRRVLRPGGFFIASTLLPDTDSSKVFMEAIRHYETVGEEHLPKGLARETILQALREFVDRGAGLLRLEEEGIFHFWHADAFSRLFVAAGFQDVKVSKSFGDPAQACIAMGRKA